MERCALFPKIELYAYFSVFNCSKLKKKINKIKNIYNSDRMCDYAAALCSQSRPETGTGLLIDWRCSVFFISLNLRTTSVPTSISISNDILLP